MMPMPTQATHHDTRLEHLCLDCGQSHPAPKSNDRVECYVCGLQLCCLQDSRSTGRCQHCAKRQLAAREPIDVNMNVINTIHPDAYRAIKNTWLPPLETDLRLVDLHWSTIAALKYVTPISKAGLSDVVMSVVYIYIYIYGWHARGPQSW